MKLEFSRQIFEKSSNIKFHENPSSGSRVVPCGRTYMTKLIVAFRNFASALQKEMLYCVPLCVFSIAMCLSTATTASFATFQVLTAVLLKIQIFWDVTTFRSFGGPHRLHLQGRAGQVEWTRSQNARMLNLPFHNRPKAPRKMFEAKKVR